jgi:hypothetical protein
LTNAKKSDTERWGEALLLGNAYEIALNGANRNHRSLVLPPNSRANISRDCSFLSAGQPRSTPDRVTYSNRSVQFGYRQTVLCSHSCSYLAISPDKSTLSALISFAEPKLSNIHTLPSEQKTQQANSK